MHQEKSCLRPNYPNPTTLQNFFRKCLFNSNDLVFLNCFKNFDDFPIPLDGMVIRSLQQISQPLQPSFVQKGRQTLGVKSVIFYLIRHHQANYSFCFSCDRSCLTAALLSCKKQNKFVGFSCCLRWIYYLRTFAAPTNQLYSFYGADQQLLTQQLSGDLGKLL